MSDIEQLHGDLYNPALSDYENHRTPTVFKSGAAQSNASLWTPAAGKLFRLLGFTITISNDAASATNDNAIGLTDGVAGVVIASFTIFVPTSAIATPAPGAVTIASVNWDSCNGRLSTVVNNPLRLTFAGALTAGFITCNTWGTEE